jgi:hypothetical protein
LYESIRQRAIKSSVTFNIKNSWILRRDGHELLCEEIKNTYTILHNKELHRLYSAPSIIRMIKSRSMRWAGHIARMGEKRNAYRILVGKPEGKRPL